VIASLALLDALLAGGPSTVRDLASAVGLSTRVCAANLEILRWQGRVNAAPDGTWRLTDPIPGLRREATL